MNKLYFKCWVEQNFRVIVCQVCQFSQCLVTNKVNEQKAQCLIV